MSKKLREITLFFLLIIILPLLPVRQKLFSFEVLFVTLAGLFIYLSQPAFDDKEMMNKSSDDKMSALGIIISFLLMFLIPILDFGYFQTACTSNCLWIKGVGAFLAIAGLSFRYWSISTLGKFFTSTVQIQENHRLVENGPYKYLRHPSYSGAYAMALGIPLVLGSWIGFCASLIIAGTAYAYRMSVEEKALKSALGDIYLSYMKKTWRMIPGIY